MCAQHQVTASSRLQFDNLAGCSSAKLVKDNNTTLEAKFRSMQESK